MPKAGVHRPKGRLWPPLRQSQKNKERKRKFTDHRQAGSLLNWPSEASPPLVWRNTRTSEYQFEFLIGVWYNLVKRMPWNYHLGNVLCMLKPIHDDFGDGRCCWKLPLKPVLVVIPKHHGVQLFDCSRDGSDDKISVWKKKQGKLVANAASTKWT